MIAPLTRRRVITVAAAAGLTASFGVLSAAGTVHRWRGTALGADAELLFDHPDETKARDAIEMCLAEVERLEAVFSLYRSDSEVSRLNRIGRLMNPSADLLSLLRLSKWFGHETGGAFDISVQPLWEFLVAHFAAAQGAVEPDLNELARVASLVDVRKVEIGPDQVTLQPGMALTFNGIAQGYITDRVAGLLRQSGWRHVLINLGELRALDGRVWPIRLAHSDWHITLANAAVATSAGSGTPLSPGGGWHHLIDPQTGQSAAHYDAVSVVAPDAATADAWSTAFSVCSPAQLVRIASRHPSITVYLRDRAGRTQRL